MVPLYPLRFESILRRLIWGGRRLGTVLHKPIGSETDYAESWELSDYHDKVSVVSEGPLAGTTLRALVREQTEPLLGASLARSEQFPLLVKFIDAHQALSVQVHPSDELARRMTGDNGKTETWVILAADPGSLIYCGLKEGIGPDDLRHSVESGQVERCLHRFEARPGDNILIRAGTVHSIGAGVLLLEIQEMSDTTFRVFDWNRVDAEGKARPLHISEAMKSIDFALGPVNPWVSAACEAEGGGTCEQLAQSPYFALQRLRFHRPVRVGNHDRFTILVGLDGSAELRHERNRVRLEFGQTLLLPAAMGPCEIVPEGDAAILECVIP
jgi:mannose-6-phosphate isomerase